MFWKKIIQFSAVVLIFILSSAETESSNLTLIENKDTVQSMPIRLYNTTEPLAYELWLETKTHLRILDYTGRVRILLKVLEATNMIVINAENLDIRSYSLFDHFSNQKTIYKFEPFHRQTIWAFILDETLRTGQNYVLDIKFSGHLQTVPRGFCYTRYVDESGEFQYVATSFLHVTNARMAFPCYDEPRFRTSFLIHMTHDPSMMSASNMPVASISNNSDGTVTTTFQEMPSISINLVAFTVSNYETRTVVIPNRNLELSFYIPKHQAEEITFAMDFMSFMLVKFEEYLGINYTLPKLDCVVINDLMHTGLENWGLMVFESKSIFFKTGFTSISQTMDIARTITHQLSHNYFGNLVGISWWNYAWLTEGFAHFHEFYFSTTFLTDYPFDEVFVTDFVQRNLVENSYLATNALSTYGETRREIENAYTVPMSSKSAAVLRMCEKMLGIGTFRKGLQKYIQKMSLKVAEPEDLYENLQEAIDENQALPVGLKIGSILKSWTEQPGYPLLTVTRNYQSNEIVVNQQRFLSSREEHDRDRLSWFIPLTFATASRPDMEVEKPLNWLPQGTRELVLTLSENRTWSPEEWVLFNILQGYYRVNYDTQNWKLLSNELYKGSPFTIDVLNRAQLIDDAFSLAYSDVLQFPITLDIIKYIRYEEEYAVWVTANRHLQTMIRRLEGPSFELFFGRFLRHLTEDHFERLDVFENTKGKDSVRNSLLRPILVDLACRSGSGKCLIATRTMVTAEALTGHRLTPREKPSVYYCHGLRNADENTFRYFWKKLHTITNEQERTQITNSLGCYHNAESLYELLMETADPNLEDIYYMNVERFHILSSAFRNGHVKLAMEFLKKNHHAIAMTYTYNFRMENVLKEIASGLQIEDHQEMANVLKILQSAGHITANMVERCMIDMEYHRKWVEENKMKIDDWINEYFQPAMESSTVILSISYSTSVSMAVLIMLFFY
ncbi:hypothetical protein DMENIID0001_134780 [Sergentomyia squamirostris]